jgi:hypothetical protein
MELGSQYGGLEVSQQQGKYQEIVRVEVGDGLRDLLFDICRKVDKQDDKCRLAIVSPWGRPVS